MSVSDVPAKFHSLGHLLIQTFPVPTTWRIHCFPGRLLLMTRQDDLLTSPKKFSTAIRYNVLGIKVKKFVCVPN